MSGEISVSEEQHIDNIQIIAEKIKQGGTVVLSGELSKCSRKEAMHIFEEFGLSNSGSVSRKTAFLIVGEGANKSKLDCAALLGIPICTEEDLWAAFDLANQSDAVSAHSESADVSSLQELQSNLIVHAPTPKSEAYNVTNDLISWDIWDESIHDTPAQIKRIAAAQKIALSKIKVDKNAKSASVVGSGFEPYISTLGSCTCPDFHMRQLPCKHMYRLAILLQVHPEPPSLDKEAAKSFDIDKEITRYFTAYKNGIISGEKFAKIADALSKGK